MRVENIVTSEILEFDDNTSPEYALFYAQCVENEHLASWFFNMVHDNKLAEVKKKIKLYYGELTISSGDWYYRKTTGTYPASILE